ncbi:metal-sensitive transcriptional regulator [Acetobacter sp. TBRC 12305]|uniref:Metal-sensitive transcriptional regulator n=1 Tax=Acetobacter garciniae TaxID=2817435 RepID=A0A939HNK6_9PROT|nr:metal-sensitive transcriptional regulator [Acetobacter garciniae]MBO1326400.1 metal-sensitive transcriptional regulator [Acetobacter garciniae]MBX0346145.1 metal-sensitive transcriptional regulator [Acetobacter garciniae]
MATDKPGCGACSPGQTGERHVIQPDKTALINRLRRIEGQIGGVTAMVREDRYCVDILTQLSAIRSAVDAVSIRILETHAKGCVRQAMRDDDGDETLEELMGVIRKMIR